MRRLIDIVLATIVTSAVQHRENTQAMRNPGLGTSTLLWVDLKHDKTDQSLLASMAQHCAVKIFEEHTGLLAHIEALCPNLVCFDFDTPDSGSLHALQRVKQTYPSIPVLMITKHHSEALAIWALRARVWDYLIKPVSATEICQRITALAAVQNRNTARTVVLPGKESAESAALYNHFPTQRSVHRAIDYFGNHYQEKISVSLLAKHCEMSPRQFTRSFKQQLGFTVREYLASYRMDQASTLLKQSSMCVGEVAFACGFHDHAYFSRMFRKYIGSTPSDYRLKTLSINN